MPSNISFKLTIGKKFSAGAAAAVLPSSATTPSNKPAADAAPPLDKTYTTVEQMRLREALAEPYHCHVLFTTKEAVPNVVGYEASLSVTTGTGTTELGGVITELVRYDRPDSETFAYGLVIEPKLSLLKLNHRNQIYGADGSVDVKDLIAKICDNRVPIDLSKVTATYPKREFIVQHNESDLNFLMRHCENYGIHFHFDVSTSGEIAVFSDGQEFPDCVTSTKGRKLTYGYGRYLDHETNPILQTFIRTSHVVPASVKLRDYNPNHPDVELFNETTVPNGLDGFQLAHFGDNFLNGDGDGKLLAQIRAEELFWRSEIFEGTSNVPSLRVGRRFELDSKDKELAHPFLIISAEHVVATPESSRNERVDVGGAAYRVQFRAIRQSVAYRPPRRTPKPLAAGILTAKVDGAASGDTAQIDDKGRYKVRFHLDTGDKGQEKASEYLRRATDYSGPQNTGMHLPLLRGTEVILACVNGDIDRPIIVGAVPNGANPNVVTDKNNVANLLRTPSGSAFEMNDGTTTGASVSRLTTAATGSPTTAASTSTGATYQPSMRMAAPVDKNDIASGSYFRLGAYVQQDEGTRMPSKSTTAPLKYTKNIPVSTVNPAPEPQGTNWQDYVKAATEANRALKPTDQDQSRAVVTIKANDPTCEASVPLSLVERKDRTVTHTNEAEATTEPLPGWSLKNGQPVYTDTTPPRNPKPVLPVGSTVLANGRVLRPGYTDLGNGEYLRPGFYRQSNGTIVASEYANYTKYEYKTGEFVYLKPGFKSLGSDSKLELLRPGFIRGHDGIITRNRSAQIELNQISLQQVYNESPSGDGMFASTNKDLELRVDGGAVMQIGKGHHLKVIDGDYQVAVDQGALFLGASSGVDIRAGSAAQPANIALTAYGYIRQQAFGPSSDWFYSTREVRTYGFSRDWFYGERYAEFHGKEERKFFGDSVTTTIGSSISTFIGARINTMIGVDLSLTLAVRTSISLAANLVVDASGFLRFTAAFGATFHVGAEWRFIAGYTSTYVMGIRHTLDIGTANSIVNGLKTETINGSSIKTVTGVEFKKVTGIDSKHVNFAVEYVDFIFSKKMAELTADELAVNLGQFKSTFAKAEIESAFKMYM